jgi:hypothetical protein
MVAGYGAMHAARIKRVNNANTLFDWTCQWLDAKQFAWLQRHRRTVRSLVEVDLASGKVTRTVRRIRGTAGPFAFPLSISPDGRTAVTTGANAELVAIDLRSGKLMRSPPRPDGAKDPLSRFATPWRHVAGWLGDNTVCVQYFEAPKSSAPINRAYSWDIETGSLSLLRDFEVPVVQPKQPRRPRLLYVVPGSTPPAAIEVPDQLSEGLSYGQPSTLVMRDLSEAGRAARSMTGPFWASVAPVFGPDGSFFIRCWGGPDIQLWSLSTGSAMGSLKAPGFMGTLQEGPSGVAYHGPSRRLFVATSNPDAIHVRDVDAEAWIATLSFGFKGLPNSRIAVSPDGRWVAIQVNEVKVGTVPGPVAVISPVPAPVTSDGSAPVTSHYIATFVKPGPGAPSRPANTFVHHLLVFDLKALDR